jgi:hypothetical protein
MYYYTMNDQAISRAYQQSFPGFAFLGYPPANQPAFTESWLTHQLGIKLPVPWIQARRAGLLVDIRHPRRFLLQAREPLVKPSAKGLPGALGA